MPVQTEGPTARILIPHEERIRARGFQATSRLCMDVPELSLLEGDYVIFDRRGMPAAIFRPLDPPDDLVLGNLLVPPSMRRDR